MRLTRYLIAALAALMFASGVAHAQAAGFVFQSPRRAWLGFSYGPVSSARGQSESGVVVREVVAGSPAERAGVEVGDTIVRINDINATEQLIASLGSALSPGDDVRFDVRRAGRTRTVTITAAKPPADYVQLGPSAGLLRIDGDSIRSLVRIFVDSAAAGIDSLRLPNVFISRGGVYGFRTDSLPFVWTDSVMLRGDTFRFFDSDSLRAEFDSLRTRLRFGDPMSLRLFSDSVMAGRGGRAFIYSPGDSAYGTWTVDGTPFGFTIAGRSAIAGAELTRLDPAMEEYFGVREGVLVTRVPRDTPAARAGFEVGDVIVRVNGSAVTTVDELRREIQRTPRTERARIEVVRRKQRVTLELGRD